MILASAGAISLAVDIGEGSPHGSDFEVSCSKCHSPSGWHFDRSVYSYDHDAVFELAGTHKNLDCRQCHTSLVFKDAPSQCFQCHSDVHQNTLGLSCDACHSSQSWLVSNITEIHQNSRFPLMGAHAQADCQQCHKGSNPLIFEPLSTDCFACHQAEYHATTQPAHAQAGFSTDCSSCHTVFSMTWEGSFNHHFFPLIQGHAIAECNTCHQQSNYSGLDPTCYACHQQDFLATNDPNHQASGFSTSCTDCHDLSPGWPSNFDHDNRYFPIYSGKHAGEWNLCTDCHTTGNMQSFSCIDCHEHNRADMDDVHRGENGYAYESSRCLDCHPNGDSD